MLKGSSTLSRAVSARGSRLAASSQSPKLRALPEPLHRLGPGEARSSWVLFPPSPGFRGSSQSVLILSWAVFSSSGDGLISSPSN